MILKEVIWRRRRFLDCFNGQRTIGRGFNVDIYRENDTARVATALLMHHMTATLRASRASTVWIRARYTFRAHVASGDVGDVREGSFHTLSGQSVSFAFTSCTMIRRGFSKKLQGVATLASRSQELDFYAMLGDTIYADVPFLYKGLGSDTQKYYSMYRETLGSPEYAELRRKLPGFFQIDDHEILNDVDEYVLDRPVSFDFGIDTDTLNETSSTFRAAVSAWNTYLGVSNTGVISKPYHILDAGPATLFFLDTRTSRVAANGTTTPKSFLGTGQNDALRAWLSSARADQFKILISPQPWTRNMAPHSNEGWIAYPEEREAILDYIEDNDISGCVFLSGDLHQAGVRASRGPPRVYSKSPRCDWPGCRLRASCF